MKFNTFICYAFFLLLLLCIIIFNCFNLNKPKSKSKSKSKPKSYTYYTFNQDLSTYAIEPLKNLSMKDIENKCKHCVKPTPTPKPKCKKKCNTPTNSCNINSINTSNTSKLCCPTGAKHDTSDSVKWCGNGNPTKLTLPQVAQAWNEVSNINPANKPCAANHCTPALYNAIDNSNGKSNCNSKHVTTNTHSKNGLGLFNLSHNLVKNSSNTPNCQQSVLDDPCKQIHIQQTAIKNNCKLPNWTPYDSHKSGYLDKDHFKKAVDTCHNIK